jgi:hypothetical protein
MDILDICIIYHFDRCLISGLRVTHTHMGMGMGVNSYPPMYMSDLIELFFLS